MLSNKNDKFLMSFGKMPIANNFLTKENFKDEFFYEMKVGFNEDYSLFKLLEHPTPEQMFNSKYPFLTGSSTFMVQHFNDFSKFKFFIIKFYFNYIIIFIFIYNY